MTLFFFTLLWFLLVYAFNSVLARKLKPIDIRLAALYISTVSLIGIFGEVFLGTFYELLVGKPLWQYHLYPIHDAHTSLYSTVVWGMYGFYLYLLHDNLAQRKVREWKLAAIVSFEAMVLELLLNVSYYALFGDYFFFYLPGDLWHFTTIQVIPFYFVFGAVVLKTIRRFRADPRFFTAMNLMIIFVFGFIATNQIF